MQCNFFSFFSVLLLVHGRTCPELYSRESFRVVKLFEDQIGTGAIKMVSEKILSALLIYEQWKMQCVFYNKHVHWHSLSYVLILILSKISNGLGCLIGSQLNLLMCSPTFPRFSLLDLDIGLPGSSGFNGKISCVVFIGGVHARVALLVQWKNLSHLLKYSCG